MPGSKPTPDPVVDHGQTVVNPAANPPAVPWRPPVPPDPLHPWTPIPLNIPGDGNPAWPPIIPGYPNGPWDPLNPQPGPNDRTITFNPGPTAALTINYCGGRYQIPWANLCNPDGPKSAPAPSGGCSNEMGEPGSQPIISVGVDIQMNKYIRELNCSVQITCTIQYTITTTRWVCVFNTWGHDHPTVTQTYTERSYIFQCC
jgi:hypothetical protein